MKIMKCTDKEFKECTQILSKYNINNVGKLYKK